MLIANVMAGRMLREAFVRGRSAAVSACVGRVVRAISVTDVVIITAVAATVVVVTTAVGGRRRARRE